MAKKKNAALQATAEQGLLFKIAEAAGFVAGKLEQTKNQVAEMAGTAAASVKSTVNKAMATKAPKPKAKAAKKAIRKSFNKLSSYCKFGWY